MAQITNNLLNQRATARRPRSPAPGGPAASGATRTRPRRLPREPAQRLHQPKSTPPRARIARPHVAHNTLEADVRYHRLGHVTNVARDEHCYVADSLKLPATPARTPSSRDENARPRRARPRRSSTPSPVAPAPTRRYTRGPRSAGAPAPPPRPPRPRSRRPRGPRSQTCAPPQAGGLDAHAVLRLAARPRVVQLHGRGRRATAQARYAHALYRNGPREPGRQAPSS